MGRERDSFTHMTTKGFDKITKEAKNQKKKRKERGKNPINGYVFGIWNIDRPHTQPLYQKEEETHEPAKIIRTTRTTQPLKSQQHQ